MCVYEIGDSERERERRGEGRGEGERERKFVCKGKTACVRKACMDAYILSEWHHKF